MEQQKHFYELPEGADFSENYVVNASDDRGKPVRYVQLSDGRVAKVRTGKGKDIERATMIAGGDQSKYFSAMMAAVTEIEGAPVFMEDLAELDAKDYLRIQTTFADINF